MTSNERERKSRAIFISLIVGLILAYGAFKYRHIAMAMQAYQGQVILENTEGAAK